MKPLAIIAIVVLIISAILLGYAYRKRILKGFSEISAWGGSEYADEDADEMAWGGDCDAEYADEMAWGGDCAAEYDHIVGAGPFRLYVRDGVKPADKWYTKMLKGEKKVEVRLDRKPFDQIKVGDDIVVVRSRPKGDTSEYPGGRYKYTTTVIRATKYNNLEQLLKGEGAENVYPGKLAGTTAASIFSEFLPESASVADKVIALELAAPT
jgi:ASC-1-like (ASCH) protein